MSGLTKDAVSAAFIRGYEAALCNHDIPGWSLRQEADKAADEVLTLARNTAPRFCTLRFTCGMADGHDGECRP